MENLKLLNGTMVQLPVSETASVKRYECESKKQAIEVTMTLALLGNVGTTVCKDGKFSVEIKKA